MDFEYAGFSINDGLTFLMPLTVFAVGMAFYAIFIFRFYRFLSRRDIFRLDFSKYEKARLKFIRSVLHLVFYVLKYLILFPFVAFFWFAVLTVLLLFLAKNQTVETILLVSIAVVSAVRVTAYYDEDLSRDLAKILPFALLGVFLVDLSYFSLPTTIENMQYTLTQWRIMVYYLAFAIVLELVLRITTPLIKSRWPVTDAE
ncbi:MAG: hypothetical protein O2909_12325 [Chloroflexi bacterium]|nr:hypothetical protein [Chloroflexota bacterium]